MKPSQGPSEAIRPAAPGAGGGAPRGPAADTVSAPPAAKQSSAPSPTPLSTRRSFWTIAVVVGLGLAVVAAGCYFGIPWLWRSWSTVSTDDAYVNGHVTFVAPRVPGQVVQVLVDDNKRVKKGDLLVELDKEPYQIQVNQKEALLATAKADQVVAQAQVRSMVAQARSNRFKLEHAMEHVNDQVAQLRATVAAFDSGLAKRERALKDYERIKSLMKTPGATTQQELDLKLQDYLVAKAQVRQALEGVYQIRAGLGLPTKLLNADDLTDAPQTLAETPTDLDQTFSSVRQALQEMIQSVAPLGVYPSSYDAPPKRILEEFRKRDPEGNLDRIYAKIIQDAPTLHQAKMKVDQAQVDLDQALLNRSYCEVRAEIDGVVTRRNVNPGNNLQAGQSVMAVRSITEIWIDANFKETQLRDLRIGQRVDVEVDMYGSRRHFEGRISGFTMGTGSTLALLPPQNATGNYVKVVQRLPVRIELTQPNPEDNPLFIGLSVVPYVFIKEPPTGPDAGKFLQPDVNK